MAIVTFTVSIEVGLTPGGDMPAWTPEELLSELEEVVAKRGLDLHDSGFEVED